MTTPSDDATGPLTATVTACRSAIGTHGACREAGADDVGRRNLRTASEPVGLTMDSAGFQPQLVLDVVVQVAAVACSGAVVALSASGSCRKVELE